jgi:citronellol/citronellal dehydrogenase
MAEQKPFEGPVFHPELLKGQVALVTGGGSGLGSAIAQGLAEAGADLLLAARRLEPLEEAAASIRQQTGRRVEVAQVNIRDRETVESLAELAVERFGQIDVLVNNAGGQFPAPAREIKPKGWNAVVDTNLTGTWNMIQVFGNQMLDGTGGCITNMIAVVGRGFPGIAHSVAARAGVLELSRTLAHEWGRHVRVNCLAPGPIWTAGFDAAYSEKVKSSAARVPMQRFGTPREVANAAVFLSSPAAAFVSGEVLYVAGGQQVYGPVQALPDRLFERDLEGASPAKPAT